MMAQFPCLPLWTDAWVADTHHLTGPIGRQKRCLYLDLLVVMWRTPYCRVPDDNGWLMDRLHVTKDEVRELLRPVIEEFCDIEGNFIVQHRLQKEFVHRARWSKQQGELAKRRWRKHKANSQGNADAANPPSLTNKKEP